MIDRRAALLVLALPALLSPALGQAAAQTIQAIQGRGHVSPLLGADVTGVEGVVTTLASMGARRGAFLQDPRTGGDGDTATSDAVFVALPPDLMGEIRPGDLVRVAGRVGEQRGASTGLSVTQIEVRTLERVARDVTLPEAVRIGATGRMPPGWIAPSVGGAIDGPAHVPDPGRYSLDFYETLEGMRVVLGDAQAIGPRNSYGEVAVAADLARTMPLANARGGATTGAGATIAGRLIADDVLIGRAAMPDARVGDRFGDAVGIVDYAYSNYRLLLTSPPEFTSGGLVPEIAAAPRPGEVSIASFNVQNLAGTSRAAKFTALARQITGALRAPEILALSEIQDDDGTVDSGTVTATRSYDRLVAAIVAAGGPRYAVAQIDPADGADGGAPGGNIRVAFLYDPLRVGFVPRPGGTADRAVALLPDGTLDANPGRIAPSDPAWTDGPDGFSGTRKPLAAMFEVAGRRLLLVAAHLKSRSEDQPDFGRIQAPGEPTAAQRLAQADAIARFLTTAAGIDPRAGIVLLGDLNAPGGSPPLARLAEAGLFDLALGLPPAERYSYIFEGASQDLDHVLVNAALRDIARLDIVHLNAEFPLAERASDHDPLLLRLAFAAPVPEPSSLALMLVPALLAAARRRPSKPGTEPGLRQTDGGGEASSRKRQAGLRPRSCVPGHGAEPAPGLAGGAIRHSLDVIATDNRALEETSMDRIQIAPVPHTTPRATETPALAQADIDRRVFELYDEYCHGRIDRRTFMTRSAAAVVGGLAMAEALLPHYARAQTISFTDPRIKASYVAYDSPGGNSGTMRGYLVQPTGQGPFPAVLVIHENRGLNPYVEDVARRLAADGFLALAPDGLAPLGGYPGNDDDGREMQTRLDQAKLRMDMLNGARFVKAHPRSTGRLGITGFCWGGGTTNWLAATLGSDLQAGVPYYGAAAATESVPAIRAAMLVHYAESDERINAMWPSFEAAMKAAGTRYEMHVYPGTQHGFHNNSTPRFHEVAAKLSWERTVSFFRRHLA